MITITRTESCLSSSLLPGAFGVRVAGLDLNHADDATMRQLGGALFDNHILVVTGQNLTDDQYVAFGRRWGRPVLLVSHRNRAAVIPK